MLIISKTLSHVLGCTYASCSGIYYIYGVLLGYISQYTRLDLGFLRPRSNPSGATPCPRASPSGFDLERKKPRPRRAILLDIALQDPIYTLHILKKVEI